MKIAVISNLHGNLVALSAFLSEIERLKEDGEDIQRIYVMGIVGYFPYPREVCELIKSGEGYLFPVRGFYDHAVVRYSDESERADLREELSDFEFELVKWTFENMGRECRKWLRNYVPAFTAERFGNNEILFVYGSPFDPLKGRVEAKMPTSYYESIMAPIRKYEMVVVGGTDEFVAETVYGKVVCPGAIGFYRKGKKPSYAVVDTKTLDVYFGTIDFKRSEVEERIKEANLPGEVLDILYHGKVS